MATLSALGTPPKLENGDRRDAKAKPVETICSMCKALGRTFCQGHGGGGGGSSDKGKLSVRDPGDLYENEGTPSLNLKPSPIEGMLLSSFLEASEVWHESPEEDLLYGYNNDLALIFLSLNLSQGLITFKENKLLDIDEQKDLATLYDAINNEFKQFKKELSDQNIKLNATLIRVDNKLSISFRGDSSKYYDAFVTRLMDKNLIPAKKVELELAQTAQKQGVFLASDNKADDYKSPTPFDISRGPRPPGYPEQAG
ncbi:hypothetical protein [Legionella gresilensis]|uniref:hypothetical protein n=1 Tax=Legionella gresilensis TaxID=91823 RepID=UPI0010417B3B|nr:hypothetical protein [Legionella gresilensis]